MERPAIRMALAAVALAAPLAGCATRGSVSDLEQRVTTLEQRLEEVSATAERAVSNAERAADRADDAARTSEAIFRKGVSK